MWVPLSKFYYVSHQFIDYKFYTLYSLTVFISDMLKHKHGEVSAEALAQQASSSDPAGQLGDLEPQGGGDVPGICCGTMWPMGPMGYEDPAVHQATRVLL